MMMNVKIARTLMVCLLTLCCMAGCEFFKESQQETITITDQLGRRVKVPKQVKKISALYHFGGKIVYALNQQHLLVGRSIFGREAVSLNRVDKEFAALPDLSRGHSFSIEGLVSLNPEVVFFYATSDKAEMEQLENAGVPVIALKGETFEESFAAIRLISKVLNCREKGEQYIKACRDLLGMVEQRLKDHGSTPLKVMFAGPKSIYSAATGNMLQTRILELSGAVNVADKLKGFWADVSPEQIAMWNPDVVFLGSSLDTYGKDRLFTNPHFQTVKAIKDRKIYSFPSNIGWWDYPAPNCVLGVVWSAKTLYPKIFSDIDMTALANQFYKKFVGYTFEEMGGRLN